MNATGFTKPLIGALLLAIFSFQNALAAPLDTNDRFVQFTGLSPLPGQTFVSLSAEIFVQKSGGITNGFQIVQVYVDPLGFFFLDNVPAGAIKIDVINGIAEINTTIPGCGAVSVRFSAVSDPIQYSSKLKDMDSAGTKRKVAYDSVLRGTSNVTGTVCGTMIDQVTAGQMIQTIQKEVIK